MGEYEGYGPSWTSEVVDVGNLSIGACAYLSSRYLLSCRRSRSLSGIRGLQPRINNLQTRDGS